MNFPKKLSDHDIKEFKESGVLDLSKGRDLKAYTHFLFPHFRVLPMHSHNYYEINIVVKGHGMHYIGNNICPANAGNAYVIPPNIKHGYYSEDNYEIFHLILGNTFLHNHTDDLCALAGYSYLFEVEPILRSDTYITQLPQFEDDSFEYIKTITNRMKFYDADDNSNLSNRSFSMSSLALNIISELCALSANVNINSIKNNSKTSNTYIYPISKAMMYISEHFAEKISFHTLAAELGMSYPTFYRSFTEINQTPPAQYLKQYRIKNAIRLLNFTNMSIADIALECGFYDSAHFIKAFTSTKHISPGDYRLLIKKDNG